MSPIAISLMTLAFCFGGALFGIFLRTALPENHVTSDSKDIVKLGMGLVGTMAALVLGLLIASAKSSLDTQGAELTEMSSKLVLLDRVLAHYGPEAQESRDLVRAAVGRMLDGMESQARTHNAPSDPMSAGSEVLYDKVQALVPANDGQRTIRGQALGLVIALGQMRWLMYEQRAKLGFHALTRGPDFVAYHHLRQLRHLCAVQRDRAYELVCLCAFIFGRNLSDFGDVYALWRTDSAI